MELLKKDLENKIEDYRVEANQQSSAKKKYQFIYYLGGIITIIMTTVQSMLLGSRSISSVANSLDIVNFTISLIVSIITLLMNFLSIEKKISQYHTTSLQLKELASDISSSIIINNSEEELLTLEEIVNEKIKFINSYKIDPHSFILCDI